MKKEVSPKVIVAAVILLLLVVGLLAARTISPPAPEYTVSPPQFDADGAVAKRANYLKTHGHLANGATAPTVQRDGP